MGFRGFRALYKGFRVSALGRVGIRLSGSPESVGFQAKTDDGIQSFADKLLVHSSL